MTEGRTKQVQEIEALLAERRKYEQWLAQLEARRESTPSHVFVKVHGDYEGRLAEAQKKLSSESGAVRALATELETTLAAQDRQIAERADERAEAELRAAVGEFAGKEWDKLRTKLDAAIAELSSARDGIQQELDTLRALLAEAAPVSSAGERQEETIETEVKAEKTEKAEKAEKSEKAGKAEKTDAKDKDVDDIAFLRSVLGRNTPYASTPAPSVPDAPAPKRPSVPVTAPVAELIADPQPAASAPAYEPPAHEPPAEPERPPRVSTETRASSTASGAGSTRASTSAAPRKSAPELFAMPEMPEEPSGPRGSNDHKPSRPSGTFGQATPRTSEAIKSLKCQECGTLNFPTEWYCERCGGELAAF
jgi:hypothetical protein